MEIFAHYFRLAFLAALIILPVAAAMFLAIKTKIKKNPDDKTLAPRLKFYKSLMMISGIFIPIYFFIYSLFLQGVPYLKYQTDKQFINEQLKPFMNDKLPNDSAKSQFEKEAMHYLKEKHKDTIYLSNFKYNKADSVELNCLIHYINNPNLTDSAKSAFRDSLININ